MIYNSYQKSIFNAISNNNTNIVITAMAGSGKTSTIVESLNYIGNDKKVLYCAFNKSIEIELNERIDKDNVVVSTLHAFGFSMLKKHIGYVPKDAATKDHILCRRCFQLKNYHKLQTTSLTKDDFLNLLDHIGEKDCLFVYMIDLFDFEGSRIQGLLRHIGYNDVVLS